jgi:hypothetical protein
MCRQTDNREHVYTVCMCVCECMYPQYVCVCVHAYKGCVCVCMYAYAFFKKVVPGVGGSLPSVTSNDTSPPSISSTPPVFLAERAAPVLMRLYTRI